MFLSPQMASVRRRRKKMVRQMASGSLSFAYGVDSVMGFWMGSYFFSYPYPCSYHTAGLYHLSVLSYRDYDFYQVDDHDPDHGNDLEKMICQSK